MFKEIKKNLVDNIKYIYKHQRDNMYTYCIYLFLRLFVFVSFINNIINGTYESAFMCLFVLFLFLLPLLIEKNFKITLPSVLEGIILFFIFGALILGEINGFYMKIPLWDSLLHVVNGFICGAVGFSLVDILNKNSKFKYQLSPIFIAVLAFSFSMTIGVLWEIFEFGVDYLFKTDMQKDTIINNIYSVKITPNGSIGGIQNIETVIIDGYELPVEGYLDIGLIDTMKDLIVNIIGALLFSILGYYYIKKRGKKSFASNFIPMLTNEQK